MNYFPNFLKFWPELPMKRLLNNSCSTLSLAVVTKTAGGAAGGRGFGGGTSRAAGSTVCERLEGFL